MVRALIKCPFARRAAHLEEELYVFALAPAFVCRKDYRIGTPTKFSVWIGYLAY